MKKIVLTTLLCSGLWLTGGLVFAEVQTGSQESIKAREPVYGSQLMTEQERIEHREKMRAAKSREEREQIRNEHHKLMKERAKERGVTLPEPPPQRTNPGPKGQGQMPGPGPGKGGSKGNKAGKGS